MDSKNLKIINYNIDLLIFASIILHNFNLPSLELEHKTKKKTKRKYNKINKNKINNSKTYIIDKNINKINKRSLKRKFKKYLPKYEDYIYY